MKTDNFTEALRAMLRELELKKIDLKELLEMISDEYEFWVLEWANETFEDIKNESDERELDWQ